MLPGILNQLGTESLTHLKRLASVHSAAGISGDQPHTIFEDDDDVPGL